MTEHPTQDDLVAYSVGALDPHEEQAVAEHVAACERCESELAHLAPAVGVLAESVEQVQPPPELRERLMATVRAEAAPAETTVAAPRRSRFDLRSLFIRPAAGLAVAVVAIAALGGYLIADDGGSGSRTVPVTEAAGNATGELVVSDGGRDVEDGADAPTQPGIGLPGLGGGRRGSGDSLGHLPSRRARARPPPTCPRSATRHRGAAGHRGAGPESQPCPRCPRCSTFRSTEDCSASLTAVAETCYRHPNRETGVSCSNCGRPICPECMTSTPVGMRCPECASQRTKVRTAASIRAGGARRPDRDLLAARDQRGRLRRRAPERRGRGPAPCRRRALRERGSPRTAGSARSAAPSSSPRGARSSASSRAASCTRARSTCCSTCSPSTSSARCSSRRSATSLRRDLLRGGARRLVRRAAARRPERDHHRRQRRDLRPHGGRVRDRARPRGRRDRLADRPLRRAQPRVHLRRARHLDRRPHRRPVGGTLAALLSPGPSATRPATRARRSRSPGSR